MDGIVAVHKPAGPTSHDIVRELRRITGQSKCGHTGTLDPPALGVLVLCFGKATRLIRFLPGTKGYVAYLRLGVSTDTGDAQGRPIGSDEGYQISKSDILVTMARFRGVIEQIPPMVSAIHHEGRRLYELAREGIEVPRSPRKVEISEFEPVDYDSWPDKLGPGDEIGFSVRCSQGTYIRSLCTDICEVLGVHGHMSSLLRVEASGFSIAEALSMSGIRELGAEGVARSAFGPERGLSHLDSVDVDAISASQFGNGRPIPTDLLAQSQEITVRGPHGFIGIGRVSPVQGGHVLRPVLVY